MVISFEELRKIKDSLPDGSIHRIAERLNVSDETVRNYFGGYNFRKGNPNDVHFEKGSNGGYVKIEDPSILEAARAILAEEGQAVH